MQSETDEETDKGQTSVSIADRYLIFDHVHVVICGVRLLLCHLFQMVHQVGHVHPELLGICTLACRLTEGREESFQCNSTMYELCI